MKIRNYTLIARTLIIVSFAFFALLAHHIPLTAALDTIPVSPSLPYEPAAPGSEAAPRITPEYIKHHIAHTRFLESQPLDEDVKEGEEVKESAEAAKIRTAHRAAQLREQALAEREEIDPNTRVLFIFLDTEEIFSSTTQKPVTKAVMEALTQKAGPILTPRTLLSHIFSELHQTPPSIDIASFRDTFDATQWSIHQIPLHPQFFLLIPQQYLLDNPLTGFKDTLLTSTRLPIKNTQELLAHFNNPTYYEHTKQEIREELHYTASRQKTQSSNTLQGKTFVDYFSSYFSNAPDAKNLNWVVVIMGHGEYDNSIATLSIVPNKHDLDGLSDFQKLLKKLTTAIKTKLFAIFSCYAAGTNMAQVFTQTANTITSNSSNASKTPLPTTYPFPIATIASTDAPTSSAKSYPLHFDIFTHEARKQFLDYPALLETITPATIPTSSVMRTQPINLPYLTNIAHMRPAYVDAWLPVSSVKNAIIQINSSMVKARLMDFEKKQHENPENPPETPEALKIGVFKESIFYFNPIAILLATNDIPFDIMIDPRVTAMPPLISTLPGETTHTLKSLTCCLHQFRRIPRMSDPFVHLLIKQLVNFPHIDYGAPKTMIIKKLMIAPRPGQSKPFILTDVVIKTFKNQLEIEATSGPNRLHHRYTAAP